MRASKLLLKLHTARFGGYILVMSSDCLRMWQQGAQNHQPCSKANQLHHQVSQVDHRLSQLQKCLCLMWVSTHMHIYHVTIYWHWQMNFQLYIILWVFDLWTVQLSAQLTCHLLFFCVWRISELSWRSIQMVDMCWRFRNGMAILTGMPDSCSLLW